MERICVARRFSTSPKLPSQPRFPVRWTWTDANFAREAGTPERQRMAGGMKVKQKKRNEVKLPCVTPWLTDRCFFPDLAGLG